MLYMYEEALFFGHQKNVQKMSSVYSLSAITVMILD